jgi:hypothetical protein
MKCGSARGRALDVDVTCFELPDVPIKRLLSNVTVRRRNSWLLAASALASSSLGISGPALAACTPPDPVSGAIDCSGSFATNINNNANITLQAGVTVTSPGGNAVNSANTAQPPPAPPPGIDITVAANGTTLLPIVINNTANFAGGNNTGLRIQGSGNANITATNTTIDVNGTASDWAILAFAMPNTAGIPHVASVNWSGQRLSSSGLESGGIQADNRGNGNAIVVASGNVNVVAGAGIGPTQYGLLAHAGDSLITGVPGAGDASVK